MAHNRLHQHVSIVRCKATKVDELNYVREGFKRISTDGVMNGCVGTLDGYLLRITAPSFAECQNVAAYFSGHYCTYTLLYVRPPCALIQIIKKSPSYQPLYLQLQTITLKSNTTLITIISTIINLIDFERADQLYQVK